MKNFLSKDILFPILTILVSVPVILPYFHTGYFPTHDGEWAVVRLSDMFRELKDFQIPPRYSGNLNFGYGYPLFNFTYPMPYYAGVLLLLLKLGFVNSIKILFALSVPFASVGIFLLSKNLWKNNISALLAAILFTYLPYKMVDLFVRGSIGESLSFALLPFIMLGILKISKGSSSIRALIATGVLYAALIMTHNIMAVFYTPIILVFGYVLSENKKFFKSILTSLFLGILLSAFFWIPALFEKKLILLSQIPIADRNLYFVKLSQLFDTRLGYGVPTSSDGFSYQIGLPHIAIFLLAAGFLFYSFMIKKKKIDSMDKKIGVWIAILAVISTSLMFQFTSPIWKHTPFLSEINYPWILLGPIGFLLSLLIGFVFSVNRLFKFAAYFLVVWAVVLFLPYAKPEFYTDKGDQFYITNEATTTSSNELMPLWVYKLPISHIPQKAQVLIGGGAVSDVIYNSKKISFNASLLQDSILRINTIYYPGWNISVDGVNQKVFYDNINGVMDLSLPAGKHKIQGVFKETNFRLVADMVSVVSLITCGVLFVLNKNIKI